MLLEKMDVFFDSRLDGYEAHMLDGIASAREFYPFTAACLPAAPNASVLDLGCGTGLELDMYFKRNPAARITGIDLAPGMLAALRAKYPQKDMTLLCGSYFDLPFGENCFDAAVSVESLHHFTMEEKLPLYARLHAALKADGFFVLTDYFSLSDEEELSHRQELLRLKGKQGITDEAFYHFDAPLTVSHEMEVLQKAGFSAVEVLAGWGATCTLKAVR